CTREVDIRKDLLGVSSNKTGVAYSVRLCVLRRKQNRIGRDIDTDSLLNTLSTGDGKQSRATVRIDQVLGRLSLGGTISSGSHRQGKVVADISRESGQD